MNNSKSPNDVRMFPLPLLMEVTLPETVKKQKLVLCSVAGKGYKKLSMENGFRFSIHRTFSTVEEAQTMLKKMTIDYPERSGTFMLIPVNGALVLTSNYKNLSNEKYQQRVISKTRKKLQKSFEKQEKQIKERVAHVNDPKVPPEDDQEKNSQQQEQEEEDSKSKDEQKQKQQQQCEEIKVPSRFDDSKYISLSETEKYASLPPEFQSRSESVALFHVIWKIDSKELAEPIIIFRNLFSDEKEANQVAERLQKNGQNDSILSNFLCVADVNKWLGTKVDESTCNVYKNAVSAIKDFEAKHATPPPPVQSSLEPMRLDSPPPPPPPAQESPMVLSYDEPDQDELFAPSQV